MKKHIAILVLSLVSPLLWAAQPQDASGGTIEERLSRLERVMNSQALVDMQLRLNQMQQDIQSLRGQMEDLNHQLDEVKSHQRDLYQDVDRRLLNLERGGSTASGGDDSASAGDTAGELPSMDEQKAYQQGINLLKEFRYAQAAKAFDDYLKKFPKGRYAPIARYWLADSYYSDRQYEQAIKHYKLLLKESPNSPKAAQALLKIGYSQAELKHWKAARASMEAVIKQYPKSTEAGLAQRYLDRLKQQGH